MVPAARTLRSFQGQQRGRPPVPCVSGGGPCKARGADGKAEPAAQGLVPEHPVAGWASCSLDFVVASQPRCRQGCTKNTGALRTTTTQPTALGHWGDGCPLPPEFCSVGVTPACPSPSSRAAEGPACLCVAGVPLLLQVAPQTGASPAQLRLPDSCSALQCLTDAPTPRPAPGPGSFYFSQAETLTQFWCLAAARPGRST